MTLIHSLVATSMLLHLLVLLIPCLQLTEAKIGVCYGRNGNNLPSQQDVINFYKSQGIAFMRLYDPDQSSLQALRGSGIGLILDVPRYNLWSLASDFSAANWWVQNNVVRYASDVNFRYIAVGNEIHPFDNEAWSVLPAMQNILRALQSANLAGNIKVSTSIDTTLITNSYPPSNGVFTTPSYINPIIDFLKNNGAPLLVNIYPYFAYAGNPQSISLNYALFTAPGTVVTDWNNGLQYQNLFDAMTDAMYAALARAGASDMAIVLSESGWPSGGGFAATYDNAGTYYRNLINHVKKGTPRKWQPIETYLFAMFDENLKAGGIEQNFGVFTPNKQSKYQLNFFSITETDHLDNNDKQDSHDVYSE